ncbi:hypothetical protein VTJ83DRAFT_7237 [Remersonia thermophila]|uniref:Protein SSH4 n=1 Tax=Remersonia thermophila TaxID=72144 RepID=A0ABR4D2X8_9PEZI
MTNPYQQLHATSPPFANGDYLVPSGGLPPLSARRPSYASIVSGPPSGLGRPARSGPFSHLLNPDDASSGAHDPMASYSQHSGPEDPLDHRAGAPWQSRTGSAFPYFSRAFDLYMSKDALFPGPPLGSDEAPPASTQTTSNITSTGFLAPSYLRGTVFLRRLEEKHRARVFAEQEGAAALAANGSSSLPRPSGLASNGSSASHLPVVGAAKLGPGHRGVGGFDVLERSAPGNSATAGVSAGAGADDDDDDDIITPLPSRWNKDDKEAALEVLGDGYEVRHTGRASSDHEASAIRADHYMPPSCGVYYFEITVLNGRSDKIRTPPIAIGFASKEVSTSRAPGWEPGSWGYHGDDGYSFASQNTGQPYAEVFGVGDTVGCLVNFRAGHALFTKNGKELPIAFKDIPFKDAKRKLYPIVSLKKKEDHITTNFGQRPFLFDIDGYMKKQQDMIDNEIRLADTSRLLPGLSETSLIQELVLQFLQHDGYVETARAFAEELEAEKSALRLDPSEPFKAFNIRDDEDAHNRQRIRRAVLEGDIDLAMELTKAYYPTVLRENEHVYFRLRCRKFIEMIRKEAELNMRLEERRNSAHSAKKQQPAAYDKDEEMLEAEPEPHSHHHRHAATDSVDTPMSMEDDDDEEEEEDGIDTTGLSKLSQEALIYGMELRAEFSNDPRRETAKQLDEISSLIAYPNPLKVKEVAHLLDGSGRVAVAEELNSAILTSLGKSSRAALENLYAQTCVLLEDLRKDGGDGAFVTVESVVKDIPPARLR